MTRIKLTTPVPFGKYKGMGLTVGDIARKDPEYCIHILSNTKTEVSPVVFETAKLYKK